MKEVGGRKALWQTAALFLLIPLIFLSGCGGGGGDDDEEGPELVGDPFFPLQQGNLWNFNAEVSEDGFLQEYDVSVEVSGTVIRDGQTVTVLTHSSPDVFFGGPFDFYVTKTEEGIFDFGNNDPEDPITDQIVPYQAVRFPLVIGSSFVAIDETGVDTGEDIDGDGINETFDIKATVMIPGLESIAVPVGTFAESVRIRTTMNMTFTFSSDGSRLPASAEQNIWLVENVGPVRETNTISVEGINMTETRELIGYRVDNQSQGVLP